MSNKIHLNCDSVSEDCEQNSQDETNSVIKRLHTPLFQRGVGGDSDKPIIQERKLSVSVADDILDCTIQQYCVTVNPNPSKKMNNRMYKLYSHDQQRAILCRIESAMRRDNPSIKLIEIHFELCPVLQQQHYHALYSMPFSFESTMENYLSKRISDKTEAKVPWRPIDIMVCNNRKEWLKYIRKDQPKDDHAIESLQTIIRSTPMKILKRRIV